MKTTFRVSHYKYLEKYFREILEKAGHKLQSTSVDGWITAHGDKASGYEYFWAERGIPFCHGAAIYLLSYAPEFQKESRETTNGWVAPQDWVANNYHAGDGHEFWKILPPVNPSDESIRNPFG